MKRFLLLIAALFIFPGVYAQKDLPIFAQWSECFVSAGICQDVILDGDKAYVGSFAGLLIMDISDPENPNVLSFYYTEKHVFKIFLLDEIVFLTSYNNYNCLISILDISNPIAPALINSFTIPEGSTNESIYVHNDNLYLGMDYYGLYIYDVSELSDPVFINHLPDIKPRDMVVRDTYLYMVANNWYTGILDVSDITNPTTVYWEQSGFRSSIRLADNYLYLSGDALEIFDITNPEVPVQICGIETKYMKDMALADSLCFTMTDDSLYLFNIQDPYAPQIIDTMPFNGFFMDFGNGKLAVTKGYGSDDPKGISIFTLSSNQHLEFLGEYHSDDLVDVVVSDDYAFVCGGGSGLHIIDANDPSNPGVISSCLEGDNVQDVIIEENYAYVRTNKSLKIIDISDPYQPLLAGAVNFTHNPPAGASYSIEKYQDIVYIGGEWYNEIIVVDVTDPANPESLGIVHVNDWSPGLDIFNEHLYVAGYWGGLEIFDLQDPANPVKVGQHPMGLSLKVSAGENMAFVQGHVYTNTGGIEIFDISNITSPSYIGDYPYFPNDLQCSGDYLFHCYRDAYDYNSAIQILDMSVLYDPLLYQEIPEVYANGIYYEDDLIYAAEDHKLKIFGDITSVRTQEIPARFKDVTLWTFPNPFQTDINIEFQLAEDDHVELQVFNSSGNLVDILVSKDMSSGIHNLLWNGDDMKGNPCLAGIYIISFNTSTQHASKKVVKY